MNIQSYIDRKRNAGAREHEGNKTDWAGWTVRDYWVAVAGELLDALAYLQRLGEVCVEMNNPDGSIIGASASALHGIIAEQAGYFEEELEAACQEAEQEAENG